MSITSYHPSVTEGSTILGQNDLSFKKIRKGRQNQTFQFTATDSVLATFYQHVMIYEEGRINKQQLIENYQSTMLSNITANAKLTFVRFLTSPNDSHRNLFPHLHEFRSSLFHSPAVAKNSFEYLIEGLNAENSVAAPELVANDYKNLIFFMIRNENRRTFFFDHYANGLLRNQVDSAENYLKQLHLSDDQFNMMQRQFVLHLISEKRDSYNLFHAFKDHENRDYVGHDFRNKLDYNHQAIGAIFSATQGDQELLEAIYFFIRDKTRTAKLLESGWLNTALQSRGDDDSVAARLKRMLFPPSEPILDLLQKEHWWTTTPWNLLYQHLWRSIDEIAQLHALSSQHLKELDERQLQLSSTVNTVQARYKAENQGKWFRDNTKYAQVQQSKMVFDKARELYESFKKWFNDWKFTKVSLNFHQRNGELVATTARMSWHLTQVITNPEAYELIEQALPLPEQLNQRRFECIRKTVDSPIAEELYKDENLRQLFNHPDINYEIAKIIFKNPVIPYPERFSKLKNKNTHPLLIQAYKVGLAANARLKPNVAAYEQLLGLISENRSYLQNDSFIKVFIEAIKDQSLTILVRYSDLYPELLDKPLFQNLLQAKYSEVNFSQLIAIIDHNNPQRERIISFGAYQQVLQQLIALQNISLENLVLQASAETHQSLRQITAYREAIQTLAKNKTLGECQSLQSQYPWLKEIIGVSAVLPTPRSREGEAPCEKPAAVTSISDQKMGEQITTDQVHSAKDDGEATQMIFNKRQSKNPPLQHRHGPLASLHRSISAPIEGEPHQPQLTSKGNTDRSKLGERSNTFAELRLQKFQGPSHR